MFPKSSVRPQIQLSKNINNDLILEMHALRAKYIRLKPEISVEHDFEKFSSFFRDGANAVLLRDNQGQLRGFFGYRIDRVTIEKKTIPIFWKEYLFLDRQFRGDPAYSLAWLKIYFKIFRLYRVSKLAVFAITFPASHLFGVSQCGHSNWYSTVDPYLSSEQKGILDFCIQHYLKEDFDSKTRRVSIRTIPFEHPWTVNLEPGHLETLNIYEKKNPDWRSGIGLPVIFQPSAITLSRSLLKRLIRKTRSRKSGLKKGRQV